MRLVTIIGVSVLSTPLLACDVDRPERGVVAAESVVPNGENLNGENLNGENLNGENLNGENLNTDSLGHSIAWAERDGAHRSGVTVDEVKLDGSQLVGASEGLQLSGADLIGTELVGRSDTGRELALRIAAVTPPETGDIWRYRVEYRGRTGGWYPICRNDLGPVDAIAVDGWWDPSRGTLTGGRKRTDGNRFTFACTQVASIGKCVDFGYRPWAEIAGVSLAPFHEACVRLLRADYCGDGTPHTVNGTRVNIYDQLGVQLDERDWNLESGWTPAGATCMSAEHHRATGPVVCADGHEVPVCGEAVADDALLVSETLR